MLKGFGNFLFKELKELVRDPKILLGMIIVPLLMFPLLGSIMSYSIQSAQEQAQKATILVVNNDEGTNSTSLIAFLNSSARVSVENNKVLDNNTILELLAKYNTTYLIEIPSDFSVKIEEHESNKSITAYVRFYGAFSGTSLFENVGSSVIDSLIYQFNRAQAPDYVTINKSTIIKGNIVEGVDPNMLTNLMYSQAIAMPITIMILLTYSMQIAATSVAMEKEEKTLETLLTLPMDRFAILMGKLSGTILVAGIGALAYMVGFNYYMGSLMSMVPAGTSIDLAALGLVPSVFGYLLLGISLFVTLLSALALAVIVSAFVEDVRSAQSIVGYIYPLIFIPALALMYLDINTLPLALKILLYAIPYSDPIITSKAVIMGDYLTAIIGIVYVTAFTLVVMYVASRLFATEKILTAKLKFKGLRKREKTPKEEFQ
ncbi:MAG: ABC transporter permease [Candidatus Bathyarchaeota archaeon]|nr:ABC transporter permease [Candidatus Bathyarchaeota archaeon A05DMB-5]MDH7558215.1 ABC transporter permease [Candidatus Bathyarchaeota archaeon]